MSSSQNPAKSTMTTVALQLFCHMLIPITQVAFLVFYVPITLFSYQERAIELSALGKLVASLSSTVAQLWYVTIPLLIVLLAVDGFVIRAILLKKGLQAARYWFFGVLIVQGLLLLLMVRAF